MPVSSCAAHWRQALALCGCTLLAGMAGAAGPSAADLARAEELVQGQCFVCHGADGESSSPVFPRLAGQHASYTARQLADYQSGRRKSSAMQPMVADLKAADFLALGHYFERKPTQVHAVDDPALAQAGRALFEQGATARGVPACTSCHGANGAGTEQLPRLAGQHAQYTEKQLKAFHQRERTNDNAVMHAVASQLTALEIKAVAAYISGLR